MVHSVVALHRIAKSTDYRELRSSNKLREQLASLASNAADAVSKLRVDYGDEGGLLRCGKCGE